MSRKLAPVFLAMLVLAGAMSLKTAVVKHGDGNFLVSANGPAPSPALRNGTAPLPQTPW